LKAVVVMPTYNEASNLAEIIGQVLSLDVEGLQVLIVDDNSPDGTGEIADRLAVEYPGRVEVIHRKGKRGFGTAYLTGFARALEQRPDFVFQMDADFSHSPQYIPQLLDRIRDYDAVIGSRYVAGGRVDPRWSLRRRFLSWGGNLYTRLVTGLRVKDATAGFNCYRYEALQGLDLGKVRSDGYAFQIEMHYACQKKGYRLAEVPIFFGERGRGESKMSSKIIWEALWRVWQIKWRY
jgi:dolichol-phosphate mannosyltransferase